MAAMLEKCAQCAQEAHVPFGQPNRHRGPGPAIPVHVPGNGKPASSSSTEWPTSGMQSLRVPTAASEPTRIDRAMRPSPSRTTTLPGELCWRCCSWIPAASVTRPRRSRAVWQLGQLLGQTLSHEGDFPTVGAVGNSRVGQSTLSTNSLRNPASKPVIAQASP